MWGEEGEKLSFIVEDRWEFCYNKFCLFLCKCIGYIIAEIIKIELTKQNICSKI